MAEHPGESPRVPLPEVIMRPCGKPYRPRKITGSAWEDDDEGESGVIVFGTHNPDDARPFAARLAYHWYGLDYVTDPVRVWLRDGFEDGERRWVSDPVRGRAGVWFTATDYDPAEEARRVQ